MKRSELQQIIREEIYRIIDENDPYEKAMDKFNTKVGVGPSTASNKMKYETLPGYDTLPLTRKDIDWKNRKSIILPSNFDPNTRDELMSKEDVKEWYSKFIAKFKEQPQFKVEGSKIKVLNGLKPDWKGMQSFGTKGD